MTARAILHDCLIEARRLGVPTMAAATVIKPIIVADYDDNKLDFSTRRRALEAIRALPQRSAGSTNA